VCKIIFYKIVIYCRFTMIYFFWDSTPCSFVSGYVRLWGICCVRNVHDRQRSYATVFSLCFVDVRTLLQTAETHFGLHAKWPILLSDFYQTWTVLTDFYQIWTVSTDFYQIWTVSTDFLKSNKYQISHKCVQWEQGWCVRTDVHTDGRTWRN
jgi:hypothetical protein